MSLPTQYARIVLNYNWQASKTAQNIFWYEMLGAFPSNYDIAAAASSFESSINAHLLSWLSSDVVYSGLDMRLNNNGVIADASTYPSASGTGAAGTIPNEVAAVVHWQTAQPGRSGSGRTFWTYFEADWAAGGRLSSSGRTALSALATNMNTPFTNQGITWQMRLLSRKLDSMFPIASFVIDEVLGTQRRRRPNR